MKVSHKARQLHIQLADSEASEVATEIFQHFWLSCSRFVFLHPIVEVFIGTDKS